MSFSTHKTGSSAHKKLSAALLGSVCSALIFYGMPAQAQLVDYDSLQSLFGEPVTTSATGVPQRVSDVPVNMTIITADEIRQSGTRSIPQIIGLYVPGVDILRGADNSYDVGIRGYQQPFQSGLLVLVDGRQVFVDDYSRTIWDNIPVNIDDIKQIEVIKGASSAFSSLFGSNAGYGVINIITSSPLYDKTNVANLTVGTQNTITGDGTATVKGDNWGSKFTVGGLNANEFNTPRNYFDTAPYKPLHSYFVNSSVVQINPKFQVNTEVNYSESRSNTADSIDDYIIGDQKTTSYSGRVGFNWQTSLGVISNNNYYNSNYSVLSEPIIDGGSAFGQNTQTFVSQLQDQFKVGSNNIFRLGTEYRYETFTYGYSTEAIPESPKLDDNRFSGNGMWLWNISDKLSLTNAIRFDSQNLSEGGTLWPGSSPPASAYTRTTNAWSGNSGLVYKATDIDTFGASYGRGVLLPSGLESGGNIQQQVPNFLLPPLYDANNTNNPNNAIALPPGIRGLIVDGEGNPSLKPTIITNYEIDYTRSLPSVFSTLRISPYYTQTKDIIDAYGDPGNGNPQYSDDLLLPESALDLGRSYAYGGEIEFKGNHENFRWATSYSFSYVKDESVIAQDLNFQGSTPESHIRLLLGYTTGPWEIDGNGQYLTATSLFRDVAGTNVDPNSQNVTFTDARAHTDPYFSFGGRIGYSVNSNVTVALTGTNLSRADTQESPFPAIQRQVFLGVTGKF